MLFRDDVQRTNTLVACIVIDGDLNYQINSQFTQCMVKSMKGERNTTGTFEHMINI